MSPDRGYAKGYVMAEDVSSRQSLRLSCCSPLRRNGQAAEEGPERDVWMDVSPGTCSRSRRLSPLDAPEAVAEHVLWFLVGLGKSELCSVMAALDWVAGTAR